MVCSHAEIINVDLVNDTSLQTSFELMPAVAQIKYSGFLNSFTGLEVCNEDVILVVLFEFIAVIRVSSSRHPIDCQDTILINWTFYIFHKLLPIICVRPSSNFPVLVHSFIIVAECLLENFYRQEKDSIICLCMTNYSLVFFRPSSWISVTPCTVVSLGTPWISHFEQIPCFSTVIGEVDCT